MSAARYRDEALNCYLTAENSTNLARRLELLELAKTFMRLSQHAERAEHRPEGRPRTGLPAVALAREWRN